MVLTVEISMYPFQNTYREMIQEFIRKLSEYEDLRVMPGPTSTVVVGEYTHVMECITEMLSWSYNKHGRSVFVTKFIPDYNPE